MVNDFEVRVKGKGQWAEKDDRFTFGIYHPIVNRQTDAWPHLIWKTIHNDWDKIWQPTVDTGGSMERGV